MTVEPIESTAPAKPAPHTVQTGENGTIRTLRRIAVGLIGGTVLTIGVIMVITPGPAIVVIPTGLAILAMEFEFARRWLRTARDRAQKFSTPRQDLNPPDP